MTEPVEPIEIEIEVACSPEHVFDTWASKTSLWWPRRHSMTSAPRPRGLLPHHRQAAGA